MSRQKADAAADLAGRMLQVLESQRSFGGDAYPPTLQHLGELCDGAPSPELIIKAATKKIFTDKAVVTQKVDKKPSLSAPVYFKEDLPKPEVVLSRRMLSVLESQRRLGEESYPPTLRRLAELCEVKGSENAIRKAASTAPMSERTTVLVRKGKTLVLDAPVALREDADRELGLILGGLLRFALSPATSKSKGKAKVTAAFTVGDLAKRVPELKQRLEHAVRDGAARLSLPRGVGWVEFKGEPLFFLTENVKPSASRAASPATGPEPAPHRQPAQAARSSEDAFSPRDFMQAFRAAFEALDRRNGSTNFVKLAELREALADFSRDEFDAGLRRLRMDGVFSLDSHEGLHGSLTDEERDAGVREAGSLLVYASRR
jgi:hypothetical protein